MTDFVITKATEGTFLLTRPLRDVTTAPSLCFHHNTISTHTPLAGRDAGVRSPYMSGLQFLLTRPLRDVTDFGHNENTERFFISTHTPLAGRDTVILVIAPVTIFLLTRPLRDVTYLTSPLNRLLQIISTHTPLAGRDTLGIFNSSAIFYFYSHAPCGT